MLKVVLSPLCPRRGMCVVSIREGERRACVRGQPLVIVPWALQPLRTRRSLARGNDALGEMSSPPVLRAHSACALQRWDFHAPQKATLDAGSFHSPQFLLLSHRMVLKSLLDPSALPSQREREPVLLLGVTSYFRRQRE